jgi:hypothetical protein
LAPGIIEEGWAEVVKDVGFDTLEGRIAGWDVFRIMAFYDRGNYVAFTAILGNGKGSAAQLDEAAGMVEEVLGTELNKNSSGAFSGQCERGIELTLQGVDWEGDRVKLEVKNPGAVENMRAYVSEYCSDSSRIRPEDSCT